MLREAGAAGLEPFGVPLPNAPLLARLKAAFDPTGKLGPGRLPGIEDLSRPRVEVESS
jgi:hypothetical protein